MENTNPPTNSTNSFFSVQRLAYTLIVISLLSYFVVIASPLLIPLTFAIFLSFMLKPVCDFFDKYISNDFLSIFISSLVVILPILGIIYLFSMQVANVFDDLNSIGDKLKTGINEITQWMYAKARSSGLVDREFVNQSLDGVVDTGVSFVQAGLSSTPTVLVNIFITLLYTFFLLYYRTGLKNFMMVQFKSDDQEDVETTFSKIQKVAQKYLYGLGFVILIMGTLNSLGLYIIGIDYPMLWGFLAAFLTVIPYVGTAIGGVLPFLYAAATTDTSWQPAAVLIYYAVIQFIEGNLITPKVIGNSVSVNPMAAIISLIIGGYLWGIAGVVLALPIIATIRIVFAEIDWLKPFALLISSDLYNKEDKFKDKFNKERFRLSSIFKIKPSSIKWKK